MHRNSLIAFAGVIAAGSALFAQNIPISKSGTMPAGQSEFSQPMATSGDEQGFPEEQATMRLAQRGTHGAIDALDADGIRQALANAVQSVINGKPASLVQDFATPSRRTLGNPADLQHQLAPALARLKGDFRNRYNEPLEFQRRPEAVFNHNFFLVGDALAPAAVPLAMRDNRNHASAVIRAADDLPALRVPVVRENGQWVLAPTYRNQKELARRLRAAIARADRDPSAWPADATAARRDIAHAVLSAFSRPSAGAAANP